MEWPAHLPLEGGRGVSGGRLAFNGREIKRLGITLLVGTKALNASDEPVLNEEMSCPKTRSMTVNSHLKREGVKA